VSVLKPHLQTTLLTLLASNISQREIARVTKIDRKTIRAYAKRWPHRLGGCQSIFLREIPDFALICLPNYTDVMKLTKDNH
jgi:hypothetical protein